MDRPVSLLHVVRGEEVQYVGELEEKIVFEAKHWGRPDDGRLGKDTPGNLFSASLCTLASDHSLLHTALDTFVAKNSDAEEGSAL